MTASDSIERLWVLARIRYRLSRIGRTIGHRPDRQEVARLIRANRAESQAITDRLFPASGRGSSAVCGDAR